MSTDVCRLCNSQSTKLTSSIHDEIVSKFIEFIPDLNLAINSKLPSKVCQLCYGKAKISCDFIEKIQKVQKEIEKNSKRPQKSSTLNPAEIALKKVQKIGIKVTKIIPLTDGSQFEILNDDYEGLYDTLHSPEVMMESEDEYKPDVEASDDEDEDYKPNISGLRSVKKVKTEPNRKSKNEEVREIIIDAPITFTCSKCNAKYPDLESLTTHMKARDCFPPDVPTCKECGKIFNSRKTLSAHMATHRPRDKVICEMCAKAFNHNYDLTAHMESVHRRVVRYDCVYKCTHCQESFNSQMDLLDHVREHQRVKKEAPRMCEFCGKECKNQKSYQNHLITHKDHKPHTCTVCGKGFTKNFLLIQHMHIHTGIKAYTCDICDKSYAKRDSMRIHKKRDHPDHILP